MSIKQRLEVLPWDTLARYRLIEIIALWEGRVTSRHLGNAFGIARQQASRVMKTYRETVAENNLEYDPVIKGYRPSANFCPMLTRGEVDEYLQLLGNHDNLNPHFTGLGLGQANTEALRLPSRSASPPVVRALIEAASQGARLEVTYASLNSPQGEERILCPHTLVYAAGRWHVRAFCEKNRAFRDFVLSRFRAVPELFGEALEGSQRECDEGWETRVTLKRGADPRLTPAERGLIEQDHGMVDGELHLPTRGALVQYVLRELGINPDHLEESPRAQQLVVLNRDEITDWLFASSSA